MKGDDLVMYKGFDKFPFRNYYSYGHNNTGNHFDISLPCPMPSCKFSGFTNFFNGYDNDIKKILLTSNNTHDPVSKINYGWHDWKYNKLKSGKVNKRIMKLVIATYFVRMQ